MTAVHARTKVQGSNLPVPLGVNSASRSGAPPLPLQPRSWFAALLGTPALLLIFLIRGYQWAVSPFLPVIFGSTCGCRFAPSCSYYAVEAVRSHGVIIGAALAVIRLAKCTPLHPGGFDPVPAARAKPRCARVAASTL